jgi:hypothetical protein
MTNAVLYVSLLLATLSFLLFAWQVVVLTRQAKDAAPSPGPATASGMAPHAFDLVATLDQMGKLSTTFAKAGPLATTATLSIFFMLVALVASGFVTVGPPTQ